MSELDKVLDYLARDGYGTPIGVLESVPAARAEVHALREEVGRLRAALEEIAKDAPEERPERGDWNGNADDDYHVGIEIGRWRAGKIARAALRAQGVRVVEDGKESSDGK